MDKKSGNGKAKKAEPKINLVQNGAIVSTTANDQTTAATEEKPDRATVPAETAYNLTTDQIELGISEGWISWFGGNPGTRTESKILGADGKPTVEWVGAVPGTRETAIAWVTITPEKSPTKVEEALPYQKLLGITWEGMVMLSGGKAEPAVLRGTEKKDPRSPQEKADGAPDHFNYGLNLAVNASLRKVLETELTGPDKALARMAKIMLETGMAKTMDQAMAKARRNYEEALAEEQAEQAAADQA